MIRACALADHGSDQVLSADERVTGLCSRHYLITNSDGVPRAVTLTRGGNDVTQVHRVQAALCRKCTGYELIQPLDTDPAVR